MKGANVSAVDGDENTAMICAVDKRHADIVEVKLCVQSILVVSIVQHSFTLACQFYFVLDPQSVLLYCSD